ncbi:MAG: hypothetical protein EA352_07835 [Gemmatimonadales bacterium]|nr:MAG: hypothetical protein EA352_07835 [Gemmatimonadales bacterium]
MDRTRRRSLGFLEHQGREWACFLVTFQEESGRWLGYFSFRRRDGESEEDEIRTANIFLEPSEAEIDRKARGLGRPLLQGLLSSSIHTRDRGDTRQPPELRRWFGDLLARNSREAADGVEPPGTEAEELTLGQLRSLYDSYRIDQVAHFITLVEPDDFHDAVSALLDGQSFDFSTRDRLQFGMMVVEAIESRLPLPPFEVWAEDYARSPDTYRDYTFELHRLTVSPNTA